jgi:hypothetical protein
VEQGASVSRGVIRLVVPTPDDRRVLALPNGLAGWTLPAVPVDLPFGGWDEAALRAAGLAVGAPVEPGTEIDPGTWSMSTTGRVPAAGRTWIGVDELDRLGADASAVRKWVRSLEGRPPAHGDDRPG